MSDGIGRLVGAAQPESIPFVRFDTFAAREADHGFGFDGFRGVIEAHTLDDVVPALRTVEAAVRAGAHAAGFLCYEAARAFEPAFAAHPPRPDLPLLWFALYDRRISLGPLAEPPTSRAAAPVVTPSPAAQPSSGTAASVGPLAPSLDPEAYGADIARIHEWIAAGDTYQVNHTFFLHGRYVGDDIDLYRRLCSTQRAGYCALIRMAHHSILSISPELFFRRRGNALELRPMKGTRPRGRWPAEDDALAAELLASEKERAENLMIVDLLRNDAGRVARFGSVRVPALFRVERYPTVHQMTSTITATLHDDVSLADLMRALFPSGSITGAPKIRTSQIIAELEPQARGVYTGALGFISPGEAVFNVAIRTLMLDRASGRIEMGVGSGITADSLTAAEYRECMQKAAFVHRRPESFRLLSSLRYESPHGFFLPDRHVARLAASAEYFGFRFDAVEAEHRLVAHAAEACQPGEVHKVRILVDRNGGIEVQSAAIPAVSPVLRVGIAREPIDESDPLFHHKTTRRSPYEDRLAGRPDCDEVILVNRRGELAGCTTGNLVLELEDGAFTPPLAAGILAGIFRDRMLSRGEIRERTLWPSDLERARRILVVNSVRGARDAVLVDRVSRSA